jgi:hypothetical protein
MTAYLQHRSDDYRIFSLEVVGRAHEEHLNCDDLACTARRTVHVCAWIAQRGIHQARARVRAPHWRRPARAELRAIRESSEEFWAPRRGEQVVVPWEVTVELSAIERPEVGV